jgi:hypothetical protein
MTVVDDGGGSDHASLNGIDEGRPISTLERVISDYADMGLPLILNKHIF